MEGVEEGVEEGVAEGGADPQEEEAVAGKHPRLPPPLADLPVLPPNT